MRCAEGLKAIITDAYNPENIGKVVTILRLQRKDDRLFIRHHDTVWVVHSEEMLTWNTQGKYFKQNSGPVPEIALKPVEDEAYFAWLEKNPPIRMNCGTPMLRDATERAEKRRQETLDPNKCEF